MKRLLTLLSLIILLASCQSDKQENNTSLTNELKINWVFNSKTNPDDPSMPITDIWIEINGHQFEVFSDAQGDYYELNTDERVSWKVPKTASSACLGGYGGLIRCVYAEQRDEELHITQAWSDAESGSDGWLDVQLIKKIPISDLL